MSDNPLIIIRRCTPADAAVLSAIACRIFKGTFAGTCSDADMETFLTRTYSEPQMLAELSDPAEQIHFAEVDGIVAGYIRFYEAVPPFPHPEGARSLELSRLYVDKGWQGHGLARLLMDFFIDYAREHGFNYLWLGVWEDNERAQAFYRKYDFSDTGYTHPFPIESTPQTDQWWARQLD